MCIYTYRQYSCWCADYYVKAANQCEESLRSGKPCPKPSNSSGLDKEACGICDYHLAEKEARLLVQGISNPGYTQSKEGSLRRAATARNPNPSTSQDSSNVGGEVEAQWLGIRTSQTFPLSPPPTALAQRSEPTLPNPFHLPKLLRRSKTSSRPTSQHSDSQRSEPTQAPVPEAPPPLPLHHSKTTVQPTTVLRPEQLPPSHTFTPPPSQQTYVPITAEHIRSPKRILSPPRGTKPVKTALRDSNGFFIDPQKLTSSVPPPPLQPSPQKRDSGTSSQTTPLSPRPSLTHPSTSTQNRNSTTSSRGPLSPPRPLSECAFQSPGPSPYRNSDPIKPKPKPKPQRQSRPASGLIDPFADPKRESREEREERRFSELERRSNRTSFVYFKAEEGEAGELGKKVLRDWEVDVEGPGRWRGSGVRRWMDGVEDGVEDEVEEEGGGELYPQALRTKAKASIAASGSGFEEKREKRKSVMGVSRLKPKVEAEARDSEEEVLYSGSEYKSEYSHGSAQRAKPEEMSRSYKQYRQQQENPFRDPAKQTLDKGNNAVAKNFDDEEEVIYSDGSYETDYRYSDEE